MKHPLFEGQTPHTLVFCDIYTTQSAMEFISNTGFNEGTAPQAFIRPNGAPRYFDPSPNGTKSGVTMMIGDELKGERTFARSSILERSDKINL